MQDMVTCLTSSVPYQSYVLEDFVSTYSCYCRGGLCLMRAVTQQLLHPICHLQLFVEVSFHLGREFRLEILIWIHKNMKLSHSHSKWEQEPVKHPTHQSSSSWSVLMQLCMGSHTDINSACDWITHAVCFFMVHHLRRHRACVTPFILPKIKCLCTHTWHHPPSMPTSSALWEVPYPDVFHSPSQLTEDPEGEK